MLRDGEVRQIGTPEDLYARPATPTSPISWASAIAFPDELQSPRETRHPRRWVVRLIAGMPRSLLAGPSAIAAIRPDDLQAAETGLAATVEIGEYRGRDFFGSARAAGGVELFFRSGHRLKTGDAVTLAR